MKPKEMNPYSNMWKQLKKKKENDIFFPSWKIFISKQVKQQFLSMFMQRIKPKQQQTQREWIKTKH